MKKQLNTTGANFVADREVARHILTFDSDDPATFTAHTVPAAEVMRAAARAPIPWPTGKAPKPAPLSSKPTPASALPACDYLVVTWTVEEAKCLADTLTPGFASKSAWYSYAHNYASEFAPLIRIGAPAQKSKRLGSYFPTTIAGKRVLCFKSELHMSQDGPDLPVAKLWAQIIAETRPKLVITTGTAGGIGGMVELGDVVAAPAVQFDCSREFKAAPFHNSKYSCSKLKMTSFADAPNLIAANASHLPPASRAPKIFTRPTAAIKNVDVVTTDFFAFGDTDNSFGLNGLGSAVEMGDAVLGMVIQKLETSPAWIAVRNVSDPQMDDSDLTPDEVRRKAEQIYERFGYWTTISSAIACWALIIDN